MIPIPCEQCGAMHSELFSRICLTCRELNRRNAMRARGAGAHLPDEVPAPDGPESINAELLETLKSVQWSSWYGVRPNCPICRQFKDDGHDKGCKLGIVIKKAEGDA